MTVRWIPVSSMMYSSATNRSIFSELTNLRISRYITSGIGFMLFEMSWVTYFTSLLKILWPCTHSSGVGCSSFQYWNCYALCVQINIFSLVLVIRSTSDFFMICEAVFFYYKYVFLFFDVSWENQIFPWLVISNLISLISFLHSFGTYLFSFVKISPIICSFSVVLYYFELDLLLNICFFIFFHVSPGVFLFAFASLFHSDVHSFNVCPFYSLVNSCLISVSLSIITSAMELSL